MRLLLAVFILIPNAIFCNNFKESKQLNKNAAISLKAFGAVGDGITDDTKALNKAFSSGVPFLKGEKGAVYKVRFTGYKYLYEKYPYCLIVESNTTIDFAGATLELDSGQNSAILMNSGFGKNVDSNITILNLKIDGNRLKQSVPASGEMACLALYGITNLRVEHLYGREARQYVARFLKITKFLINDLTGSGSDGDVFSFGTSADNQQMSDGHFGYIHAEGGTQNYPLKNTQGAAAIFTVINCTCEKITANNCAGPIKIQDASYNSSFSNIIYIGGPIRQGRNTGIKVQGNLKGLTPKKITIEKAIARNAWGYGLYLVDNDSVLVKSYVGTDNCKAELSREINIQFCKNLTIKRATLENPNGYGVVINESATNYFIDSLTIKNAIGYAVQITSGDGIINSLSVFDTQKKHTTSYAVMVTGSTAKGKINNIYSNLPPDNKYPRIYITAGSDFEFVNTKFGNAARTSGYATLSKGEISTFISNPGFYKVPVSDTSYMEPLIDIFLDNYTFKEKSKAEVEVLDYKLAPKGFIIKHSALNQPRKIFWKLRGWKVVVAKPRI